MCKIIVYIPVKNDAWFVENSIRHAVEWADCVIVADESSTDGSVDIYRKLENQHSNLKIIYNRPKMDFTTPDLRNYMLEQVRKFDGNNIIFELHADEIISAKILNNNIKEELIYKLSIGKCLELPWLTLWKDPLKYRDDNSVWSNNTCIFAFRDDRKSMFQSPVFHGHRVPDSYLNDKVTINSIPVIHYQFVNIGIDKSKQALYQIFERNHYPDKNIYNIYTLHAHYFDVSKLKTKILEEDDYVPWINIGLKICKTYNDDDIFSWRDEEVLKNFNTYGIKRYEKTLIWHINWENKRQLALLKGLRNVPLFQIVDPRSLSTKIAQYILMKYQVCPFWEIDYVIFIISKTVNFVKRNISKNNKYFDNIFTK